MAWLGARCAVPNCTGGFLFSAWCGMWVLSTRGQWGWRWCGRMEGWKECLAMVRQGTGHWRFHDGQLAARNKRTVLWCWFSRELAFAESRRWMSLVGLAAFGMIAYNCPPSSSLRLHPAAKLPPPALWTAFSQALFGASACGSLARPLLLACAASLDARALRR